MPRVLHLGGLSNGASQRVFIATPMASAPEPEYVHSMLQTQIALVAAGIDMTWMALVGDCHVDDARNYLVREFLERDCTDFFFIDADQGWSGVDVVKLLRHDCDVVAGVLPKKSDFDQGYPVRAFAGALQTDGRGLIEVEGVGTGFMRIRRNVLEALYEREPRKHKDSAEEPREKLIAILFERDFSLSDRLRLSGDYAFCKKWRALGGKIFVDPNMTFAHVGTKVWIGNVAKYWCEKYDVLSPRFIAAAERIRAGVGVLADFRQLYEEWNTTFAISPELGAALFQIAKEQEGVILEAGSGLSTLIFGLAGADVFSLEHELPWAQKMRALVEQLRLRECITVQYAPLREEAFGVWYTLPETIPVPSLVFCDGPQRHWGRESIFSHPELVTGVPFIADDANDAEWLAKIKAWAAAQGRSVTLVGDARKLAIVAPLALAEAAE